MTSHEADATPAGVTRARALCTIEAVGEQKTLGTDYTKCNLLWSACRTPKTVRAAVVYDAARQWPRLTDRC